MEISYLNVICIHPRSLEIISSTHHPLTKVVHTKTSGKPYMFRGLTWPQRHILCIVHVYNTGGLDH